MSSDVKKEIGKLININKDACEFYESAQEKADNVELKAAFRDLEGLHQDVMVHLQQHVRKNGETVDPSETFVGQTQQFWGELMAKISNDVDESLVSHLEEAEDRCLHSMQETMNADDLPVETKMLLQTEMKTLQRTHDYMKSLKEMMKAA
jgi:uncharacterized protein (TIGR02284 family)